MTPTNDCLKLKSTYSRQENIFPLKRVDNEEKLSPMTHSVHCRQGKLVATPQQFIVVEMNKLKIEYELISASSLRTHSILEFLPLDVRSRIHQ